MPLLQGITRVRNATDAVGIVLKELKRQSSSGAFHLLVAVDGVNALWGRTTLKREDKSPVGKLSFSVPVSLISVAIICIGLGIINMRYIFLL